MAIYQSVLIDVYAAPLNRIARSTTHDWPIFACPNSEWKKRIVGKKIVNNNRFACIRNQKNNNKQTTKQHAANGGRS